MATVPQSLLHQYNNNIPITHHNPIILHHYRYHNTISSPHYITSIPQSLPDLHTANTTPSLLPYYHDCHIVTAYLLPLLHHFLPLTPHLHYTTSTAIIASPKSPKRQHYHHFIGNTIFTPSTLIHHHLYHTTMSIQYLIHYHIITTLTLLSIAAERVIKITGYKK
ncbi:hypothetical protein PoB_001487000 [Plakobranchus ocellatus]|uniref:Uncharacterized protein n=1 Tax=Plakobranchus ocellatus TaxID=259542 RepID=A0AAV3YZI4_9GAST|nr:hypothetical protein PoB_001487000 [Plakobranchus ocellatus]